MICDATLIFQLSTARSALPVQGASVLVTDPITGRNTRLTTDQSGRTHVLCVTAPPLSWSQSPGNDGRPYSIYHADIRAEGYVPMRLTGIQVFAGQQSLQMVEMIPCEGGKSMTNTPAETIGEPGDPLKSEQPGRFAQSPQEDDQPPGSLQGAEPGRRPGGEAADTGEARVPAVPAGGLRPEPAPAANLPEAEPSTADLAALPDARELALPRAIPVLAAAGEDDESDNDDELTAPPVTRNLAEESGNTRAAEVLTGPRAASQVYVPEYITVHLGAPDDTSARNVTVSFRDYIKNVASSEIYPTWPEAALRANILAQITFAQNRIFTEWYPSRGYNFNITNNTAYDQYFVSMGAISLPISAAWWMNCSISTSAAAARSTPSSRSTAMAPPSPAGAFPSGAPLLWPITATRRWAFCVITTATTSSLIPPRYSAASPRPIRGRRLPLAAAGRDVRTIRTWLNRIRRNYPAIPAISTSGDTYNAEMQRRCRPSSASSI